MASSRNSPPSDPAVKAVADSLDRHVHSGQALVVGFSGGLDSTVLLHILKSLQDERGIVLSAIHINHGISRNADTWQAHCATLCAEWEIPLAAQRVSVERESDDGLEAAARRARHAVFRAAEADWIILGHHANDQAETLLFNLLRGTGVKGARGMLEANGHLLRPLLAVSRSEIVAYARSHQLRWIEDESNADLRLSRNHLRHETIAGLERRFPGSTMNLAGAARRFAEAQELLDQLAIGDLGGLEADFPLAVSVLASLSELRARNALRYLLQRHEAGIPSEERLREALAQMLTAAPDRHPAVAFGPYVLRRRKGRLILERQPD